MGRRSLLQVVSDARRISSRPSSIDPAVPPIVKTYLLSGDHGTFRRYLLEMCLVLGVCLPWIGPLLGLCAVTPLLDLGIIESEVITPSTDCYSATPSVCRDDVHFDYYFWNVTNAAEVRTFARYLHVYDLRQTR